MKYVLVSVIEREIFGEIYNTYDEAYKEMQKSYEWTLKHGGDDSYIGEWYAWVNDGPNHDNYDWKILGLEG